MKYAELLGRKGARRPIDVPREVLRALEEGVIETVNLSEYLALDQRALLVNAATGLGLSKPLLTKILSTWPKGKFTANQAVKFISAEFVLHEGANDIMKRCQQHKSDMVRCWGAWAVGLLSLDYERKLAALKSYAADSHFGVREIAWMGYRADVINYLPEVLQSLEAWAVDSDENVRRFASEVTRPRGVWCAHITSLKAEASIALPLLSKLRKDESRYVQNSVANWLNDASKTQPEWVKTVCADWLAVEKENAATQYICKRAQRSIV